MSKIVGLICAISAFAASNPMYEYARVSRRSFPPWPKAPRWCPRVDGGGLAPRGVGALFPLEPGARPSAFPLGVLDGRREFLAEVSALVRPPAILVFLRDWILLDPIHT